MKNILSTTVEWVKEQVLIFPPYLNAHKVLNKKIEKPEETYEAAEYKKLKVDVLLNRLSEEHVRIEKIIEKTYKLFVIAGVIAGVFIFEFIKDANLFIQITLLYYISLMIYSNIKNLETYQKFGYGTYFEIEKAKKQNKQVIIENLIQMEKSGILKNNQNALSVACLMNIFITILCYITFHITYPYILELKDFLFSLLINYKS